MKVQAACAKDAKSLDELEEELEIKKTQLNVWLKRAVEEKVVGKLSKPVRYEWLGEDPQQSIF